VLTRAKEAGASSAGYVLLRLPGSVRPVFEARIREALPLRAERILHRIRETRNGEMYDSRFGVRGRGEGQYAQSIQQLFESTAQRLGLQGGFDEEEQETTFQRPKKPESQLALF
jgi:DNA repair photolyase